jgi:hypothetical protein
MKGGYVPTMIVGTAIMRGTPVALPAWLLLGRLL